MRILLLTTELGVHTGGIARYAEALANAASHDLGADVTLLRPTGSGRRAAGIGSVREVAFQGGAIDKRRPWELRPALAALRSEVAARPYDIVHALDLPSTLVVAAGRRSLAASNEVLSTAHGTDVVFLARKVPGPVRRWLYRGISSAVTNSEFTAGLLRQAVPTLARGQVRVTPLGVDPSFLVEDGERPAPNGPLRVLSVGRLDPRKGLDLAIRAVAAADRACPMTLDIVGAVAGDGYARHLASIADEVGARTTLHTDVSDQVLRQMYLRSDIFCLPGARHGRTVEGFGLAYLEAAAAGLPTMATSIDAVPEVVIDGITGLLSAPGSVAGLTRGLLTLAEDPGLRRELGANARQRAETFTWGRCAASTYGSSWVARS